MRRPSLLFASGVLATWSILASSTYGLSSELLWILGYFTPLSSAILLLGIAPAAVLYLVSYSRMVRAIAIVWTLGVVVLNGGWASVVVGEAIEDRLGVCFPPALSVGYDDDGDGRDDCEIWD